MNPGDVERWVVQVIDRVESRLRAEDDRVELKRALPGDTLRAARRIAGHANQVREDRTLWVIGVDDRPGVEPVPGLPAGSPDVGDWWSQVAARFDGVAPSPVWVHLEHRGKAILGLGFETERRPYVIRVPGDNPSREVPWREGTHIRSAGRSDLLRLLVPVSRRPIVTVLNGSLSVEDTGVLLGGERGWRWTGSISVYVETVERLVLPDHMCAASLMMADRRFDLDAYCFTTDYGRVREQERERSRPVGSMASRGDGQLLVDGPTPLTIVVSEETLFDNSPVAPGARGRLEVRIGVAGMERSTVRVDSVLRPAPIRGGEAAAWSVEEATPS